MLTLARHQSFGHCARRIDTGGTVIRDTRLAADAALPLHVHEAPYICVVLEGDYIEEGRNTLHCRPGTVVLHPAAHAHANRTGAQGARCVNLELDEQLLADDTLHRDVRREGLARLAPAHTALRALRHALAQDDSTAGLTTLAAALEVLAAALQAPATNAHTAWLDAVVDYLEADLTHTPTAAELSQQTGLHASHLMRAFKRHTGDTIGGYLRRRRLEWADEQLRRGHAPLAQIAVQAGFFDQPHFTRAYRQQFKLAPGQQRRRRAC